MRCLLRAAFGVLVLVVGLAAPAAASYGTGVLVAVTPGAVNVGDTIVVSGSACDGATTVTIGIDGVDSSIATVIAADDSTFTTGPLPLPAGITPGEYDVRATCGGETATTILTVLGAPTPTTTVPPDDDTLAFTGSAWSARLIQMSATLVGVGALLVLGARRSRLEPTG